MKKKLQKYIYVKAYTYIQETKYADIKSKLFSVYFCELMVLTYHII